jgi:hypothetical protein
MKVTATYEDGACWVKMEGVDRPRKTARASRRASGISWTPRR